MPRNRRDNRQADCTFTTDSLFALLEGALNPQEEGTIRAHLQSCASCNREWASLCRTESALQSAREALPLAGDLSAGFYAKLAQEQNRPRLSFPKGGWRLAAPTLAALALFLFYPRGENPAPVSMPSHAPTRIAQGNSAPSQNKTNSTLAETLSSNKAVQEPTKKRDSLSVALAGAQEGHGIKPKSTVFKRSRSTEPQQVALKSKENQRGEGLGFNTIGFTPPTTNQGEIDIEVTDTERGFESKSPVASEEIASNGVRTVTFEESDTAPKVETLLLKEKSE